VYLCTICEVSESTDVQTFEGNAVWVEGIVGAVITLYVHGMKLLCVFFVVVVF